MTTANEELTPEQRQYRETLEKNKIVLGKLFADNAVNPSTKLAFKLAYAFFYGAYAGEIPAGIQIGLMAGRIEMFLPKDGSTS